MPSPQALVAFSLSMFLLLVVLRAYVGLGPNVAVTIALVASLTIGFVVDRMIPPDVDDEEVDPGSPTIADSDAPLTKDESREEQ